MTLLRVEERADFPDGFPEFVDGPDGFGAQVGFELCESHLNGIEVWAVRRQKEDPGTCVADGFFNCGTFVGGQIVHDHDITLVERGNKLGFNIGFEDKPIHRLVDDKWRSQPGAAQGGDEGLGFPVAERRLGMKSFAFQTPPAQTCHLGCRSGLVNEHKPVRFMTHPGLPRGLPLSPGLANVGPVLFAGP